jgi:hypothetical protein
LILIKNSEIRRIRLCISTNAQLIAEVRMPIAVDKNPTGPFPALSVQEWLLEQFSVS